MSQATEEDWGGWYPTTKKPTVELVSLLDDTPIGALLQQPLQLSVQFGDVDVAVRYLAPFVN